MAGTSLLTLLDDIATTLDDVAVMTKVATKKTAGVLGDDLALNAQQVTGVTADRELPVVWAVAKGSAINKAILVPAALMISQFVPWLVTPLLMAGGLFLCFEGFEKVFEKLFHKKEAHQKSHEPVQDIAAYEKEKVKGAVRTDFILSAEIIVITLGTVAAAPLMKQVLTLASIAVLMTVGVYGFVGLIVKIDDAGIYLSRSTSKLLAMFGSFLLGFAPLLMKFLGIAGTVAMFLVGGGILTHGIPPLHHLKESLPALLGTGVDLSAGLVAGGLCLLVVVLIKKMKK